MRCNVVVGEHSTVGVDVKTDWGYVNGLKDRLRELRGKIAEIRGKLIERAYPRAEVSDRKWDLERAYQECRETQDKLDDYFQRVLPMQAQYKVERDAAEAERERRFGAAGMQRTGKTAKKKELGHDSRVRKSERSEESRRIRRMMQTAGGKKKGQ